MARNRAYSYPPNPYDNRKKDNWLIRHGSPSTFGATTALLLLVAQKYRGHSALNWRIAGYVPSSIILAASGFIIGYSTIKFLNLLRWRLVRMLLQNQGWIMSPKSTKTKIWGVFLGLLEGPSRKSTYFYQKMLPKQPLPDLNCTLDRWLDITKLWVSPQEYAATEAAVEDFRTNEGPLVQEYLRKRAEKELSWIADYWLAAAYLSTRESLAINNNYQMSCSIPAERCSNMLSRAASYTYYMAKFENLLSSGELEPVMLQNLVPLCMHGYRYIYNAVRLPGEHIDKLQSYPGNKHIVVIRNGYYFKVQMYPKRTKNEMLTISELKAQYKFICDAVDGRGNTLPISSLTAQRRPTWAKHRELLKQTNQDCLKAVESSLFMVCLDDKVPTDLNDFLKTLITGNGFDRWFDKSFTNITFGDGSNGSNVEHTGIDATVFMTLAEYATTMEEYEDGDIPQETNPNRVLSPPEEIKWNLSGLQDLIKEAALAYTQMREDLDLFLYNFQYGKGLMKKTNISPDGYVQMAMALAMHRLHGIMPKTYEPSTGRLFVMGRTETVHPMTSFSRGWITSMDDPSISNKERIELLKKAVSCQTKYRIDATVGKGCDRHLLALYCASLEMGMDIPNLFKEKTWRMPFILSTSQTPTRIYDYMPEEALNYDGLTGAFGPSCHDGYGCSYGFLGDNYAHVAITSWVSSKETDSKNFGMAISKALDDMKSLLLPE